MSNTPQEIVTQLIFDNGHKSRAEKFYFTVLDELASPAHLRDGEYSRLAIANYLGASVTVAQVATAVNWLARRGYIRLSIDGQVVGLTPAGQQVVNSRNGKEKA